MVFRDLYYRIIWFTLSKVIVLTKNIKVLDRNSVYYEQQIVNYLLKYKNNNIKHGNEQWKCKQKPKPVNIKKKKNIWLFQEFK